MVFGWFFAESRGGRLGAENYPPFALVLAALMVATVWYSAFGTQKEVPFLLKLTPKPKRNPVVQLWLDLAAGFTNRSFRWLFLGVLVVFVMAGVNSALDLYMLEYFWELTGIDMLWVLMASVVGLMVGAFFTHLLLRRAEKRLGLLLGTGVWAVCQVAPVVLRLLEFLPANGDFALFCTLFGFKFVQGVILQQAYVAFGSMMADVADEHELQAGERQEGIFFGAVAFSAKATSGFGTLIGGVGLDVIGWPRGEDVGVRVEVSARNLGRSRHPLWPGGGGLFGGGDLVFHPLRLDARAPRPHSGGIACARTGGAAHRRAGHAVNRAAERRQRTKPTARRRARRIAAVRRADGLYFFAPCCFRRTAASLACAATLPQ